MPRKSFCCASMLALVILAAVIIPAWADDGVVLINQSKVIAAGGFPYKITTAGSYRLAGNLTVSSGNAINVVAAPVSIDLNGFSISGPAASGMGIDAIAGSAALTVSNGTIQGFVLGININTSAGPVTVHDLTIVNAQGAAFASTAPARITNVSVSGTPQGVICDSDCVLQGSLLSVSELGVLSEGAMVAADNVVQTGSLGFAINGGTAAFLDNSVSSTSGGIVTGITVEVPVGTTVVTAASRNVFNLPGGTCLSGPITSLGDNVCNGTKQ